MDYQGGDRELGVWSLGDPYSRFNTRREQKILAKRRDDFGVPSICWML